MKKLLFFAAFAFLFSNAINAQNEPGLSFGAKAGVNLATITNLYDGSGVDTSGRTSFHVGALGEYAINETFSLQAEILYSDLGAEYSYAEGAYSGSGTVKLSYLSVPLLAKYYFIPGFSGEAGPQFSFNLSAKEEWDETDSMGSESGEYDLEEIQTMDIGFALGLTYELDLGLFFSARYVFGFSKISNIGDEYIDDIDYYYYDSSSNNVFQLSAGYKFN